jgi:amino acid transporter
MSKTTKTIVSVIGAGLPIFAYIGVVVTTIALHFGGHQWTHNTKIIPVIAIIPPAVIAMLALAYWVGTCWEWLSSARPDPNPSPKKR